MSEFGPIGLAPKHPGLIRRRDGQPGWETRPGYAVVGVGLFNPRGLRRPDMGNWASHAITTLATGEPATIRPRGNSMRPKVLSGATVTVSPLTGDPEPGDVVLVKVKGRVYLHLVNATRIEGGATRYQIANNRGHVNGWVSRTAIYGIATEVDNSTAD